METDKNNTCANNSSCFKANILDMIAVNIGFFIICFFTLGLGYPIAVVFKEKWKCEKTYINGQKLKFTGTASNLFIEFIKWVLLSIITFGIYIIWIPVQKQKWKIRNTHFEQTNIENYNSSFTGNVADSFLSNIVCFFMIV